MTGLDASDFQQTQKAQNAQLKIDGFPPGADAWIERDSNSVGDLVQGLTINLLQADPGQTVTITVGTDTDAILAKIEEFIEQTNTIRTLIDSLDDFESEDSGSEEDDSETTTFTGVHGNYGVNIIEQTLQSALASRGVGFTYYDPTTGFGDMYASLVSIGISTDVDEDSDSFGLLTIDYEALEAALEKDADGVASLFAAKDDGVCNSSDMVFESLVSGVTQPGQYDISYTVSGGAVTSATINGNEAKIDGRYIVGMQGNPETGLAVEVTNVTDGVYSGTVCVRQGKINELLSILDGITDPYTGALNIIENSYEEILANNETAMLNEQARLDDLEQRLIEKYARLEALLGEYEDINTALENQISSLSD